MDWNVLSDEIIVFNKKWYYLKNMNPTKDYRCLCLKRALSIVYQ